MSDQPTETSKKQEKTSFSLIDQVLDAGRAGFDELVQKPYQSIRQSASHLAGVELPEWQPVKPPETNTIGAGGGRLAAGVVEFWGLSLGVGKLAGIGRLVPTSSVASETIKMASTGGAMSLLQPVDGDQDFGRKKLISLVEGAGSGAAFGAVNGGLNAFGILGRAGYRGLLGESLATGLSGGAGGLVNGTMELTFGDKTWGQAAATAGTGLMTGIAFGGLNRAVFGRTPITLKNHPEGQSANAALTSERWAGEHYDGKEAIRSPILTMIAEKNPSLRPANYDGLRPAAFAEKRLDLSLSDWTAEQRPAVIQQLRKLARTDLASDSNLDAFVSHFNRVDVASKTTSLQRAFGDIDLRRKMIGDEIQRVPELSDLTTNKVLNRLSMEKVKERSSFLGSLRGEIETLEQQAVHTQAFRSSTNAFKEQVKTLAEQTGLPPVTVALDHGVFGNYVPRSYDRVGNKFVPGDPAITIGLSGGMTATSMEITAHEFNHHRQGLIGYEPLAYGLKRVFYYPLAKRVGWIDEIPAMQRMDTTHDYLNNYMGMRMETESWALGLLARIRAMMAGMPQGNGAG